MSSKPAPVRRTDDAAIAPVQAAGSPGSSPSPHPTASPSALGDPTLDGAVALFKPRSSRGTAEFSVDSAKIYDRQSAGRWVFSHALRYWPLAAYVIVGSVAFISLRSLIPMLVGQAFESVGKAEGGQKLLWLALSIVGAAIGHGLINLSAAYTNELIAQRVERDARDELFQSLLSKSQTFHDAQRVGDIMARATNDVKQLNLLISPGVNLTWQSAVALVVPLFMIGTLKLELLLAPLLFAVLGGLSLRGYVEKLTPLTGKMRAQLGQMNAVLNEILSNIKIVRGFVQEGRERERFGKEVDEYRRLFVENGAVQARYLPLLLLGLTFGAGFFHAALLLDRGQLTLGQVVSYMGLLGLLRFPTFISIFTLNLIQQGLAAARRILELMNARTDIDQNREGHAAQMQGEIVFDRVSFRYSQDGPWVLKDISFRVPAGSRVAIIGATGSGKTTLVKLIQRLYDATEGRILVDGIDLRSWNLTALRGRMGVIEQDTFLFSQTIAQNIAFGKPDASQGEIEAAATLAQAHTFIQGFEKGYETLVGSRGVTLSGGQKQRVAIARAILADPRILAMDDATSAVDSATEDDIQKAIRGVLRGRTSLLITHRLAQIRHADLILVMGRGQLLAQGRHEDLLRTCDEYRDIFSIYGATLPPREEAVAWLA